MFTTELIILSLIAFGFGTYHVINAERIYRSAKKQLKQLDKHGSSRK